MLEIFREVYHNDDLTKGMTKEERLRFHKEHSGTSRKRASGPSDRGGRRSPFLDGSSAPPSSPAAASRAIDNNVVERSLKKPAEWMPWNYRATLAGIDASGARENGGAQAARTSEKVALRSAG